MAEKKKGSTTEIVRALAEPLAKELGLIIWDVTFTKEGADWYLRIFIDKEGGVGIDDCVDLTRAINPVLDSEDPIPQEYTLEVSSPGMQYEIVDGFTGMGVVKIALPLSVFRKVVFFACIFILPRFLPIEQIFFCEPISDIFPPLVSVLVYALTIKRVISRGPQKQTA